MQNKPSHYFVIRSPYAQLVLTGVKKFEWRSNASVFANKHIAISVSKSLAHEEDLQDDIAYWEKRLKLSMRRKTKKERDATIELFQKNRAKAERLFKKTNGSGMIIGEIVTGEACDYDGDLAVPILKFKLWPEAKWIASPGGLGLRFMPKVNRK